MLKARHAYPAEPFSTADQFGSVSRSHRVAIEQIQRTHLSKRAHCKVIDLGVGDGSFLRQLTSVISRAECTGIDVSRDMLQRARHTLPLTTIETSVTDVMQYLPVHSQDLVLAHFINAYIPLSTLFHSAHALTRATGYFSLVTTTYDSFPVAQHRLADFINQGSLLSSVIGHYYKSLAKNNTVACSEQDLLTRFDRHGFKIIEHQRLHIPIVLNTVDELALFGIEGTWFLNNLSVRLFPKPFLLERLRRLFEKIFTFPYRDTHVLDVVLARK